MFSAAIFDMDGLLLDSERCLMNAWLDAADEHGIPLAADDYLYIVGRNAAQSRAKLVELLDGESNYRALRRRVDERLGPEAQCVFPLRPGAAELLGELAERGVPCAVASSTRHHEIRRRLAAVDVLQHFSAIAGSDEVAQGKPDPAVYLLAAQRIGFRPGACLAFEDSANGAAAALAAGMALIVVPDLRVPRVVGALALLPSLGAAIPYLKDWFAR